MFIKFTWVLSLICCCSLIVKGQHFTVLDVFNGSARLNGKTADIKRGDTIKIDDIVRYKGNCDIAMVMKGKGIYHLSAKSDPRAALDGFSVTNWLKELVPLTKTSVLGHRSPEIFDDLMEVRAYFAAFGTESTKLLIVDSLDFSVTDKALPGKGGHFALNYTYLGKDVQIPLSAKPGVSSGVLKVFINGNAFIVDGKPVEQRSIDSYLLIYVPMEAGKSVGIARFKINFLTLESHIESLRIILSNSSDANCENVPCQIQAISDYLTKYYGLTNAYEILERVRKFD